jgi:hypothetical protein
MIVSAISFNIRFNDPVLCYCDRVWYGCVLKVQSTLRTECDEVYTGCFKTLIQYLRKLFRRQFGT